MTKDLVRNCVYGITLSSALLLGCSASANEPGQHVQIAEPILPTSSGLKRVSAIRAERGTSSILQDEPATTNVDLIRDACGSGKAVENVGLGVYQLESVTDANLTIASRASALGIENSSKAQVELNLATSSYPWAVTRAGAMKLQLNALSGDETYVNTDLFHRGPGSKSTLADSEYLARANNYLGGISSRERNVATDNLYPYRMARYFNSVSKMGGIPDENVYQIAVVYSDTIDDIPVIGPGGKISVHMTVDGRIVEHEITVRPVSKKVRAIEWQDLTCPNIAREEVEARLKARGVVISQFSLKRSEFGYMRLGRHSIQTIIAPHYAFIYEPLPGVLGKKLVEAVPATLNGEVRSLLAEDAKLEEMRKASMRTRKVFSEQHR